MNKLKPPKSPVGGLLGLYRFLFVIYLSKF
jgi:hypothetical protein